MVSLPTLPTPACTTYFDVECVEVATRFYKAEQMQAYGQQCRAAAVEEAAQVCSHKAETKRMFLNESHYLECAEAIRSLK